MVESPEDIVQIYNPDLSCTLPDPEIHLNGNTNTITVYHGGVPHSIDAGQTRMFPRYLADHITKHLADHILTAEDLPVNHPKRRPELIQQIQLGTVETFLPQEAKTEGEATLEKVEEINKTREVVEDLGESPDPTGYTAPNLPEVQLQPEEALEATTEPTEAKIITKANPTRAELFEEARKLSIQINGYETVAQLQKKIRQFSGV